MGSGIVVGDVEILFIPESVGRFDFGSSSRLGRTVERVVND